jgi:hypothetical protein
VGNETPGAPPIPSVLHHVDPSLRPTRVPQSARLARAASTVFRPTPTWTRLSFLDLIGDGPRTPIHRLEPAYIDDATLVAVWPDEDQDLATVTVATWAPDSESIVGVYEQFVQESGRTISR